MIKFIICFLLFLTAPLISKNYHQFASAPLQAKPYLEKLSQLDEFKQLLAKVQKEDGPVHLKIEPVYDGKFEGFWDGEFRAIIVNTREKREFGSVICTILFELHNASKTRAFDQLVELAKKGAIDKNAYVESVERIEYENARNCQRLMQKGIELGIFLKNSFWPIPETFEEHYRVQQIAGHSQWIAAAYDDYNPKGRYMLYTGTIEKPQNLNHDEEEDLFRYVAIRGAVESSHENVIAMGKEDLRNELQKTQTNKRKKELLHIAFKGNTIYEEMKKQLIS